MTATSRSIESSVRHDGAVALVRRRFARSIAATAQFFDRECDRIADTCHRLAARFQGGGTLVVFGCGSRISDAHHVSVEFVHPVIIGKRALPAVALTNDSTWTKDASHTEKGFAAVLQSTGRSEDVALGLCDATIDLPVARALSRGKRDGMLTLLLSGTDSSAAGEVDVHFAVPDGDPLIVQEVHETLYHVLWELVHVFLEHTDTASVRDGGVEERQLYPFLFGGTDEPRNSLETVRMLVRESVRQKARDICSLRESVAASAAERIANAAVAIAERIRDGGRVLACGNGGSATDAEDVAADCLLPALPTWVVVPAMTLTADVGVLTAVANDVGFDHVFSRQLIAFGRARDVAVGFSTSGASANVLSALSEAKRRGLLTVAFSGCDGGALARSPDVDFCFTAPSDYVPRIQEAHATLWHALLEVMQQELAAHSGVETSQRVSQS